MPTRPPRPCRTCHTLGTWPTHGHCPTCNTARHRTRETRRGNRHQRGYTTEHEHNRRTLLANHPDCHWCGNPATVADHLIPLSAGGTNHPANLVPACTPCNSRRTTR